MFRKGVLVLALAACSTSSSSTSPSPDAASSDAASSDAAPSDAASSDASPCATLPATAKKQGAGCAGVPGTFTEVTYDTVAGTYGETCSAPAPYKDQAEFDQNEGTSGAAGTTITSHEDYVVTPTCASGSIDYQTSGSPKTTVTFIWKKIF